MKNYIAMDGDINDRLLYAEYLKCKEMYALEKSILSLEKKILKKKRKRHELQDELSMVEIEIIEMEETLQNEKDKMPKETEIE